jgi:hypothetical protein
VVIDLLIATAVYISTCKEIQEADHASTSIAIEDYQDMTTT